MGISNKVSGIDICHATIFLIIALVSSDVFAFHPGNKDDPIGGFMCDTARVLRGRYVKPIAIIAMVVLGIQGLGGKISWQVVLIVFVGLIIMFTAHDIVGVIIDVKNVCFLKCEASSNPTCNWWK